MCTTTDCTGTATITTIDSDGIVGEFTSIAIGNNGKPIISYTDVAGRLKVAACTAVDCSSSNIAIVDAIETVGAIVGDYTSIAIGINGNPVISYQDVSNDDLKVAACTTPDCSGTATITTIDSANRVGYWTSIAIGNNGKPVISYYDILSRNLKVAACTSTDCTGTATITTIDSDGDVGQFTSIAIGATGLPVISYYDSTNTDLKAAACTATDCTGTAIITTVSSDDDIGRYSSIVIGATGLPVVSYFDETNGDLKVVPMWSLLIAN